MSPSHGYSATVASSRVLRSVIGACVRFRIRDPSRARSVARGEGLMAKVIVGMTTSIDGFVADQSGSVERLYPDLAALQGTAYMNALIAETGAVLMGRRAFEMAEDPNWFVGNYEFQVPIFVLTHRPPSVMPKQDEHLTFLSSPTASNRRSRRRRPPRGTRPFRWWAASASSNRYCLLVWRMSFISMSCWCSWGLAGDCS